MDCTEIQELVYRYTDDELGDEQLLTFRSHVECCPQCDKRARFARRLLDTIRRRARRQCAPHHLRDRVLAVFPHRRIVS